MREGYDEIMVNQLCGGGIQKQIKVCDGCKHLKRNIMMKSVINPIYWDICNTDLPDRLIQKKLEKNVYGYIEPPGFFGEECPFHKQLLRDKNIKNILNENN
jgi:hypothetical protein